MITYKQLIEETERKLSWRSGGFPLYIDKKGIVYICLFISNNSMYGGSRPQMPKGHPDGNDTPLIAGSREVSEETGIPFDVLKKSAKLVGKQKFKGEVATYIQYVFNFFLDKQYKATKNNEGMGKWFNIKDALNEIRRDQKPFLEMSLKHISNPLAVNGR